MCIGSLVPTLAIVMLCHINMLCCRTATEQHVHVSIVMPSLVIIMACVKLSVFPSQGTRLCWLSLSPDFCNFMLFRYKAAAEMHVSALQDGADSWVKEHSLGLGSIKRRQGQFVVSQALLQRAAEAVLDRDPDSSEIWAVMLEQARLVHNMGDAATAHRDMLSLLEIIKARGMKPSRCLVPTVCADIHPKQVYVSLVLDLAWTEFCSANWAQTLEWCTAALHVIGQLHTAGSVLETAIASAGAAAALMHLQRPEAAEAHAQTASHSLAAYTYKQDGLQIAMFYYGVYSLLSGHFSSAKEHLGKALAAQHHIFDSRHPATLYLVAACDKADPPSVAPP